MSQKKTSAHVYLSSTLRNTRFPTVMNRYVNTPITTPNITTIKNPTITSQRENIQKTKLNDEIFVSVKRNFLQSQAYKRAQNYKKIDNENTKLFKRISSQKSMYSQESLKKSSVSFKSISRCSSRESRRMNIGKDQNNKKKLKDKSLIVKEVNVEKMQKQQINQFKNMFIGPKTSMNKREVNNSTRIQMNNTVSSTFQLRQEKKKVSFPTGNLLHLIAEEMIRDPDEKKHQSVNISRNLKRKKLRL